MENTLVDVYYNNELDGDKQYSDKWIRTIVLFNKVHESFITGDTSVYFDVKNDKGYYGHYGIICSHMSEAEIDKISNFDKGKPMVFIGFYQGILVSDLGFNKCEFSEYWKCKLKYTSGGHKCNGF